VISRVGHFVVVIALCLSIGMHWVALQSVAWASMLVKYSQQVSLPKAVAETFDGAHPCDLCKHIQGFVHSEKKQELAPVTIKPDLICTTRVLLFFPSVKNITFPGLSLRDLELTDSPPVPPPRSEVL